MPIQIAVIIQIVMSETAVRLNAKSNANLMLNSN